MDESTQKRLSKEKKLKSKLVQTRKVIKDKFEKAYKDRIHKERKLGEKYRPITSAIEKLQKQQEKVLAKPLIVKHSKKIKPPNLSGLGRSNDLGGLHAPNVWNVSDIDDESRDEMDWENVSLPPSDDSDDDDDDSGDVPFDQESHAVHRDSVDFPALQHFDAIDDADGAGPSHAYTSDPHTPEPIDFEEERTKRARQHAEQSGSKVKRIKLSKPLAGKNIRSKRLNFQAKDVANARKIRAEVLANAIKTARNRPLESIVSDASYPHGPVTIVRDYKTINLVTSDEDENEETVPQSAFRTTAKRRKPHQFQSKKLVKVPTVQDVPAKLRAKYGLPNKTSKVVLKKYKTRSFPLQQSPHTVEPPVPSISNPFLTRDEILYRTVKPAEPDDTPVLDDDSKSKKKQKKQKKSGSGIETEFIPYNENVAYEFYDDPNELCDRLRLLIASRSAGNTNHAQEINSLIAELRESGYIK